ncbi:hypothetical protein OIU77_008768 [Salix suchowensis]|uniref:Lipid desaturase domain-containing protein n=1 Tax=Salix suchowensis TaxID=1278906 RepID=A0ABQ9AD95_9ROSI|nr:hypothetical protein OIU77_008768 [Salix suchowensis]
MSILPQHKYYLTRSPTHAPRHRKRVICSATTLTPKPKFRPNQPAAEPQLVNPPNLVTPVSIPPVLSDPSLQSTWSHRSCVATGCVTVLVPLAKAMVGAAHSHIWLEPMLAGYIGFILADLGSGIYHWGIDNYGDGATPVFGNQIEAFQGHHKWPWTITRRQFANNLHALARAVAFVVLPIDLACNDPRYKRLCRCVLRLYHVQPAVSCVGSRHKEQAAAASGGAAGCWIACVEVSTRCSSSGTL